MVGTLSTDRMPHTHNTWSHTHVRTHLHTHTCTHTHTRVRTHLHTHTRTHTRTHVHTHAHAPTHARTHTHTWLHSASPSRRPRWGAWRGPLCREGPRCTQSGPDRPLALCSERAASVLPRKGPAWSHPYTGRRQLRTTANTTDRPSLATDSFSQEPRPTLRCRGTCHVNKFRKQHA